MGQVSVPYAPLADAFDNPGITDDSNPTAGNLDGAGEPAPADFSRMRGHAGAGPLGLISSFIPNGPARLLRSHPFRVFAATVVLSQMLRIVTVNP